MAKNEWGWVIPEGYPGPPPGADPNGHWEGGGQWRDFVWVVDTPAPPEEPPPPGPTPGGPPPWAGRPSSSQQVDWMGNVTTRPAPGGFTSWADFNRWRQNLGGAYQPSRATKEGAGVPPAKGGGSDPGPSVFKRDTGADLKNSRPSLGGGSVPFPRPSMNMGGYGGQAAPPVYSGPPLFQQQAQTGQLQPVRQGGDGWQQYPVMRPYQSLMFPMFQDPSQIAFRNLLLQNLIGGGLF